MRTSGLSESVPREVREDKLESTRLVSRMRAFARASVEAERVRVKVSMVSLERLQIDF
jgi:hypothetical protein